MTTRHPPPTHRLLPVAAVAALALAVTACGFQLRGSYRLPDALFPLQIDAPGGSAVARELRATLERQDVELTADPAAAAARLVILDESSERRILAIGSSADVEEYELRTTVRWELVRAAAEGETTALGPEELTACRDYGFDPEAVLSKQNEEDALYEDMSEDLAQRLLFRLQAWSPEPE